MDAVEREKAGERGDAVERDDTVERRTVEVEVAAELLDAADAMNIPVARVMNDALHRVVRDRRTPEEREALAKAWAEENAEALARLREWNRTHEPPLAKYQAWRLPGMGPIEE